MGRSFLELVPPDRLELTRTPWRRKADYVVEFTEYETAFINKNGTRYGIRSLAMPLVREGEVLGVLSFIPSVWPQSESSRAPMEFPTLTPRQYQILRLLAEGKSTKEISRDLVLSIETVRNHIRALLGQLNARSRLEAVRTADRLGLLAPSSRNQGNDSKTGTSGTEGRPGPGEDGAR